MARNKRELIILRAAQELKNGFYVNLGIGMPTLVANQIPAGMMWFFNRKTVFLG